LLRQVELEGLIQMQKADKNRIQMNFEVVMSIF
jgi:hypothetical protein